VRTHPGVGTGAQASHQSGAGSATRIGTSGSAFWGSFTGDAV